MPKSGSYRKAFGAIAVVAATGLSAGAWLQQPAGAQRDAQGGRAKAATVNPVAVMEDADASTNTNFAVPDDAVFVSPHGNDKGAGTRAYPMKTIRAAINRAPEGGTVVLRGGTYRQSIEDEAIEKSVVLQAYPHERPVMSGADVWREWTKVGELYKATGWTSPFRQDAFRAAEIDADYPVAGKVEQLYRNGYPQQQVASLDELTSDTFFVEPTTKELVVKDDPTEATMEITTRASALTFASSNPGTAVKGLMFTAYGAPHLGEHAMVVSRANGFTAQDNVFLRSSGAGLFADGESGAVVLQNNTFQDNGSEGAVIQATANAEVRNNLLAGNNFEHFNVESCGSACTIAGLKMTSAQNALVAGNVLRDNNSAGYWCDLGCTNARFDGNLLTGNAGAAVVYKDSTQGQITNNYVANNAKAGILIDGSDHTLISSNEVINNKYQLQSYDDPRTPELTEEPTANKAFTWNTTNNLVVNNVFQGGPKTSRLLLTNSSSDVDAPMMFTQLDSNRVSGNQTVAWYTFGGYQRFETLDAFRNSTGFQFGTVEQLVN